MVSLTISHTQLSNAAHCRDYIPREWIMCKRHEKLS